MNPPATGLLGPFNDTYLDGLTSTVSYITEKGAFAIVDPHNYMRYNGNVINSTSTFQTWWQNLASVFVCILNSLYRFRKENESNVNGSGI